MHASSSSHPAAVGLRQLLPEAAANPEILGVTLDSRSVRPGWLYAALRGANVHGARFARAAVDAGAAAVLTDAEGAGIAGDLPVPVCVVDDPRRRLADVAAEFHGRPTDHMLTFGVTGTNGKTTTVMLLAQALGALGRTVGTVGTLGARLGERTLESRRSTVTTPEATDLQEQLAQLRGLGADAVALEVSSHALALHRVGGIHFDVVGFVNLGHDHLDFHKTLEDYFAAKRRLFEPGRAETAVIWTDDEHGAVIAQQVRDQGSPRLVTVGTHDADYVLGDIRADGRLGGRATLTRDGVSHGITLALPGRHNMQDAAIAVAMLEAAGVPAEDAVAGLASAQVPGRMQRAVVDDDAPLVIVDFAHTPQAVRGAVEELAALGPVTTVLGCGGDRDPVKRPFMGEAAASGSRLVVVTDDNPRTEDPDAIRAATLEGARGHGVEVREVPGRAAAIEYAIAHTPVDGVVAILGKGHEQGQILADRVVPFDDVVVARDAWSRLQGRN
ncbi:UDP-N-acetylmuramoyl-L-alanyl-D-glutamate--2,6-diaminopimelate ligase [uncultured Tessaracoccus sp.]|uniref:UDP-N-acetylmuramoyl-L-alanyl-D-glutamate--2, 6-diaminopimelate ligase n=1 Tax=uncultured Tessaracoccus sp. TaxID=905023 RepID=UPI0025E48726|nr:UDP-N-acetylmuramoyl-L-alanyl-D-glutamate--2,6-diaminopimelate ligase [uncultured Tessaracoccus sp.]